MGQRIKLVLRSIMRLLSWEHLATDFLMASLTVKWSKEKLHNLSYFPHFMFIPKLLNFTMSGLKN